MSTTATTPDLHPLASSIPHDTRLALADAAMVMAGLVRHRIISTHGQWDKVSHIASQLCGLRMPQDFHPQYELRMKAWAIYVRLINAMCADD